MNFLEKDLEEILKTTPTKQLYDAGLDFLYRCSKVLTQVKIGNYGVADMITYSRYKSYITINVVELKKDRIGISAFLQALRYAKGIQRFFEKRGYEECEGNVFKSHYNVSINIVLIGRKLDDEGSFCFLPDLLSYRKVLFYTYDYEFDGIKFNSKYGYRLTEEGF